MRAFRASIAALLAVQIVLLSAAPATAHEADAIPCGGGVPSAGFSDVALSSIHKRDIDCISFWHITTQVGSFDPFGLVTREQMALFLSRTVAFEAILPVAPATGFTDISGLSTASKDAIQRLVALSITKGVTPTKYDPSGLVTREQMAVFLARTVSAAQVGLPDGSFQGFLDIANYPEESQKAINQMRQLGITTGTSATSYTPGATVTRQQMASFLARTLSVIWTVSFMNSFPLSCSAPLDQHVPGTVCTGSGFWPADHAFSIREGYFSTDVQNPMSNMTFTLTLDGSSVLILERTTILTAIRYRTWEATFVDGLSGAHTLRGQFSTNGVVQTTITLNVSFT